MLLLDAYAFLFENTDVSIFLIPLGYYKYYQVNEYDLFVMPKSNNNKAMQPKANHSIFEFEFQSIRFDHCQHLLAIHVTRWFGEI